MTPSRGSKTFATRYDTAPTPPSHKAFSHVAAPFFFLFLLLPWQVQECKAVLVEGLKEQNIRQMWVRKKETDYILAMLDKLEMLKVGHIHGPFEGERV